MVSSLVHVLIVTPVIFFWLRERHLGQQHEELHEPARERPMLSWRTVTVAAAVTLLALAGASAWWWLGSRSPRSGASSAGSVVQSVRADDLEIVLLSPTGVLSQGRQSFVIEFRRAGSTPRVDVGTVRASANMPMPGMVMSSGLQVIPTGVPGQYSATAEFGMAGAWRFSIQWDGPAGRGSADFEGSVQ